MRAGGRKYKENATKGKKNKQSTYDKKSIDFTMASVNLGIVGDQGDYRVNGSRFYYNTGAPWLSPNRNYSTGPALGAIAGLAKSFGKDIVTLGDNTYVSGSSSLVD